MILRLGFAPPTLLMLIVAGLPAQADLIITPTFDPSITTDPNSAAIEGAVNDAISVFESTYSNPIDVLIYFQEGGGLGESNFEYTPFSYRTFYKDLVSTDANPDAIAGLTLNGGNGFFNPVNGTRQIDLKPANARAVGINMDPNCTPTGSSGSMTCSLATGTSAVDGIISLNTNITYPPNSNDGTTYGLVSVVEHEIDEILGLGSSLLNTSASSGAVTAVAGNPAPEDLFRYGSDGARIFSVDCASATQAFFSYSGATNLAEFNNACNNGDFGDWRSNPLPPGVSAQVQDAFAISGAQPLYGPNEMAALSAIGYTLNAPEPSTWILLSISLAALVSLRYWRFQRTMTRVSRS